MSLLVKTENGVAVKFPYSVHMFRKENPNTSLPDPMTAEFLASHGIFEVLEEEFPRHVDPALYKIDAAMPTLRADGKWWKGFEIKAWSQDVAEGHIRNQRFHKLKMTDFLVMPDYPHTDESRQAWLTYRQQLRDMPLQDGWPWNYTWPVAPWEVPGL